MCVRWPHARARFVRVQTAAIRQRRGDGAGRLSGRSSALAATNGLQHPPTRSSCSPTHPPTHPPTNQPTHPPTNELIKPAATTSPSTWSSPLTPSASTVSFERLRPGSRTQMRTFHTPKRTHINVSAHAPPQNMRTAVRLSPTDVWWSMQEEVMEHAAHCQDSQHTRALNRPHTSYSCLYLPTQTHKHNT